MKTNILIFGLALLVGCATPSMRFEEKMAAYGVTKQENKDLILKYYSEYYGKYVHMSYGPTFGAVMLGQRDSNASYLQSLQSLFCNCIGKLTKEKCLSGGEALTGDDLQMWGKGNGARLTLDWVNAGTNDPDMCPIQK